MVMIIKKEGVTENVERKEEKEQCQEMRDDGPVT